MISSARYILVMYGPRGQTFPDYCPGIFEDSKNDPKTSDDFRRRLPKIVEDDRKVSENLSNPLKRDQENILLHLT